jgi:hypothetical protein
MTESNISQNLGKRDHYIGGHGLVSVSNTVVTSSEEEWHKSSVVFNCWVLQPVSRVSTNAFLKTTVLKNVFVLYFIVHYLLHVSAPIGGHL